MRHVFPRKLGPYEIREEIGHGGMATVYRAYQTNMDRDVAIKVITAANARDLVAVQRFQREARLIARLEHPHILPVYDFDGAHEPPYIVMRYLRGGTLSTFLRQSDLGVVTVLALMYQVASALDYAHRQGVVHRDVKPSNILVDDSGNAFVTDFGIARLLSDYDPEKASAGVGEAVGTPQYMAPEQVLSSQTVDHRADVYALGVIVYQILTGRRPYIANSVPELMRLHLHAPVPSAVAYNPDLPPAADHVVARALAKKPVDRYASAMAFIEELRAVLVDSAFGDLLDPSAFGVQTTLGDLPDDATVFSTQVPVTDEEVTPGEAVGNGSATPRFADPYGDSSRPAFVRVTREENITREQRVPNSQAPQSNLPALFANLIGRERELSEIEALLLRPEVRLVTLTGPSGTGKTRLSIKVAESVSPYFPDGVFWVPLEAIRDPALVLAACAQALGVPKSIGLDELSTVLGHKRLLIVLDNFEQLVSGAHHLPEVLWRCAGLKLLVTSQTVLRVRGEHEYPVPPLAFPDPESSLSVRTCAGYPAVSLFVQTAATLSPDFALTEDNVHDIVEICARLDGLPLAIELAAARTKLLAPRAMLKRLQSRLSLLKSGARDLPDRQRTLRSAIDWSYDLLTDAEKSLFERLAVFARGCTLEAAEAVCEGMLDIDVLDGLSSLVDKSFLRCEEQVSGDPRFIMLQTLREYASERLAASGHMRAMCERHAFYYLQVAEEAQVGATKGGSMAWLEELAAEHDNFRAALEYYTESRAPERGLRIAVALWRFWEIRGFFTEARQRLASLLQLPPAKGPDGLRLTIKALYASGVLADGQGDYEGARGWFERYLQKTRELGESRGIATALNNLGIVALRQKDYPRARTLYHEALSIFRTLGDQRAVAWALYNLGQVAFYAGEREAARESYEESLAINRDIGDSRAAAWVLSNLGDLTREARDYATALSHYEECLLLFVEMNDALGAGRAFSDIGDIAREQGDLQNAHASYAESLKIFRKVGDRRGVARLLDRHATLAADAGDVERAVKLAGAAARLHEQLQTKVSAEIGETLARCLGPDGALHGASKQAAWESGQRMSVSDAITFALGVEGEDTHTES